MYSLSWIYFGMWHRMHWDPETICQWQISREIPHFLRDDNCQF